MGVRLIRNRGVVEEPATAALGSALFPEFGAPEGLPCSVATVTFDETGHERSDEMFRKAYREGYAAGYVDSVASERRRVSSMLQLLNRLVADVRERTERGREDVEERTGGIARDVAGSLVAEELASSGADKP